MHSPKRRPARRVFIGLLSAGIVLLAAASGGAAVEGSGQSFSCSSEISVPRNLPKLKEKILEKEVLRRAWGTPPEADGYEHVWRWMQAYIRRGSSKAEARWNAAEPAQRRSQGYDAFLTAYRALRADLKRNSSRYDRLQVACRRFAADAARTGARAVSFRQLSRDARTLHRSAEGFLSEARRLAAAATNDWHEAAPLGERLLAVVRPQSENVGAWVSRVQETIAAKAPPDRRASKAAPALGKDALLEKFDDFLHELRAHAEN